MVLHKILDIVDFSVLNSFIYLQEEKALVSNPKDVKSSSKSTVKICPGDLNIKATSSGTKLDARTKPTSDENSIKLSLTNEKRKNKKDANLVFELSLPKNSNAEKDDFEIAANELQKKKKNQYVYLIRNAEAERCSFHFRILASGSHIASHL